MGPTQIRFRKVEDAKERDVIHGEWVVTNPDPLIHRAKSRQRLSFSLYPLSSTHLVGVANDSLKVAESITTFASNAIKGGGCQLIKAASPKGLIKQPIRKTRTHTAKGGASRRGDPA